MPEQLVQANVEDMLAQPKEDFQQTLSYVLEKNEELYKRLATYQAVMKHSGATYGLRDPGVLQWLWPIDTEYLGPTFVVHQPLYMRTGA